MYSGDCFYYAKGFIVKAANKRIAKANGFCYSDAYSGSANINYNQKEHEGHKEFQ